MNGNLEIAAAIFAGFWLGRNTTIADYGSKVYFDVIGFLIEIGIDTQFKAVLFWFILGIAAGYFGIAFTSLIALLIADKIGETSIRFAKERYLPATAQIE